MPFRPPNVEPVLAVGMPFSKHYGWLSGFLFPFLSIVFFDAATGKVGQWTWITGTTYGVLGLGAAWFFRNRKPTRANFVLYGILGALVYDAVTGLTIGPLFFGQSFIEALIGQIPFTINHVLGNVVFSLVVSPLVYRWVVMNRSLEANSILAKLGFRRA
mgnify:CR=1 FL=1